jgi:hypothetical protein
MAGIFEDQSGNKSSFRIVWAIFNLTIVTAWTITSIQAGQLQPFPLDGITVLALFGASAGKTLAERK